jgi:dTDP-4-amino-4,6-dideoxygalactose transaminase
MRNFRFLDLRHINGLVGKELVEASAKVIESGSYIAGSALREFESQFSEFCGSAFTVGVANGLDALTLSLRCLDIGPGDEVIVPSHTFIATWLAVTQVGAIIVPVAVNPQTYNIDPSRLEAKISSKTKAIIAVHLYGQPANMSAICEIGSRYGVRVIEDAAQAHGARLDGSPAGTLGDIAAFSFYPGKNLGALGDAGAVVTSDEGLAAKVRTLRNYGATRKYCHEELGVNSRLDELQASLLSVKLKYLDQWNAIRKQQAEIYLKEIQNDAVTMPFIIDNCEPVWHLFVIRHQERNRLQQFLAENGVETLIHYPTAPQYQPAYANMDFEHCPKTLTITETVLSLPIGPHLANAAIRDIAEIINSFD